MGGLRVDSWKSSWGAGVGGRTTGTSLGGHGVHQRGLVAGSRSGVAPESGVPHEGEGYSRLESRGHVVSTWAL